MAGLKLMWKLQDFIEPSVVGGAEGFPKFFFNVLFFKDMSFLEETVKNVHENQ